MDPVIPTIEESPQNTFKIIKESWKNYSKQQKLQFVGIIALVLVVPALVGSVATAKYIGSKAAPVPVTPPYSPTPTPTSTPKPTPTARPRRTPTPTPTHPNFFIGPPVKNY